MSSPLQWRAIDRCLLWLGLVLALFGFYLYRIDYLLSHASVEPYFDRHALSLFRWGLVAATGTSAGLFLSGVLLRRRSSGSPWILHGANQVWWIWTSVSAYAIGPVTTPILGLLLLGGFVSLLLFPRRVVGPAAFVGMSILVLTTVAERAGLVPYAPLFGAPLASTGRLPTPYVVGTSAIGFGMILGSLALISYLVEDARSRERALLDTGAERERARTELQRALTSLRDTEERFRQLAENTQEVFWLMEVESGKLLYVSPMFEVLWGMSVAEIYAEPERFLERVHPDDRARMSRYLGRLSEHVTAVAERARLEYRLIEPRSGEVRQLSVRAFPVRNSEGAIYRIGGLIEDVTDRRATEAALEHARAELEQRIAERTAALVQTNERLRQEAADRNRAESALRESERQLREQFSELDQLYRDAPIGLCFHDRELRYVRINERLAAINGKPVAAHIGRTVWEMVPEIAATVGPIMRRVLDTGAPAPDIEVKGSTPAEPDTERCWLTSYFPVTSPDGRILGINVVVQDISEVKWAEERARRHLENLAHVSRVSTMGQMATGMAHELNQPLAAIVNYAFAGRQMLKKEPIDEAEVRDLFEKLSAQALRAGGIVQRLRALVNKNPPERTTASINALITDVLMLVDSEFRLSGIHPELHLDETLPPVRADIIQVQQVILNLVRNALDAMSDSAPDTRSLSISTTSSGDMIEVAVRDSGNGLSIDDADQVFDSFFTTKSEGMGMGLAISRSIVQDHGGRLWVESSTREGATFRFTLPVAQRNGAIRAR